MDLVWCLAMKQRMDDLPPPVNLALAYAPAPARARFELLLRFDARFALIIGTASEAMIAQIKIAWWRDALSAPPMQRPKKEPLLAALLALDDSTLNEMVLHLADAWELLLTEENWSLATVESFAWQRGKAVFQGYARLAQLDNALLDIGVRWARDDLRSKFGARVPHIAAAHQRSPKQRKFRPLTILALSVRDGSGLYLLWHAVTGR